MSDPIVKTPIRVFDSSLNLVIELDDYASAYFTRSLTGCGEFAIQTNYNTVHATELQRGRFVLFGKDYRRVGIITSVTRELGEAGKGSMIVTAAGTEAKGILNRRVVLPPTGYEFYSITDAAETVMKTLVDDQCGPGAPDADRKFALLAIDTDNGQGDNYVLNEQYSTTVLAALTACGLATNVGFYLYLDTTNKKLRLEVIAGLDRTSGQSTNGRAIFSTDYDTLKSANLQDSDVNYLNYAFVGGEGDGIERTIREVYSGAAEPTDLNRREMFVDARDLSTTSDLDARGAASLESLSAILTIDGAALAYSPLALGTDYDLGDLVTIKAYDTSENKQITSVKESWAPTQYGIDLSFDKAPQTLQTQISSAISSIRKSANAVGATIIKSGSNSNGSWIKCGDGTLIQWGTFSTDTTTIANFNIGSYGLSYYTVETLITFPVQFIDTTYSISGSNNGFSCSFPQGSKTVSSIPMTNNATSSPSLSARWIAIGRWE